ncbi:hypothetical protein TASIC1_0004055700 [Trichoderma asperellum]|uniref:Uncharacterized protein n=1 Tax=Trichoderma asperellum TaxID=101201 RepID=A0A6V8QS25_TRIAP|nr:hypothetical protein TASIC1_0004055700 [Trichoderma asperellum]
MSSSINIPAARYSVSSETAGSSSDCSYSSSPSTSSPSASPKGKEKATALASRRPSLLSMSTSESNLVVRIMAGTALSKQECTVINIGAPDGPPRLISYLSSGQGFMWNPEIFLPSYVDCYYVPLENRRDPVHEIHLTDEEIKNMFPE